MSHEKIISLIDQFAETADIAKKATLFDQLLEELAEERAEHKGEPPASAD